MKNVLEKLKRKLNKRSLLKSLKKRESSRIYEALTPTDNIEHGEEYLAALGWALSQSNIKNIAVSGPYGSGKSSTIKTYLKRYEDSKVVYISLATFDLKVEEESEESSEAYNKMVKEQLEAAILKQLFYSVDGKRIPQSRYRKLRAGNDWKSVWAAGVLVVIILAILYFLFPDKSNSFIEQINAFGGHKTHVIYVGLVLAFFYILVCVANWFRHNGSIKEINILDKAILGSNVLNEESIFNKNMDEIIYFFESTKKKIVIIEDLDRFENSSIFVALRELNSIINNTEKINGSVKFVYATKDDMFKKPGERTKFFDFIIPVVPYISSVNSGEILQKKLNIDSYEISDDYILSISPYIGNVRDLMSICNEFNVFKNTLKGKQQLDLLDEKMLSLVIYKNLYPKDFAELEDESSECLVRKAFKNKRDQINNQNELLKRKKMQEKEVLDEIEHEALKSVKELKLLLLNSLRDFKASVYMVKVDNKEWFVEQVLKDNFDIELLKEKIDVYWRDRNGSSHISINNPEDIIKENGDYFTRIERVKKGLEKCKNDSRLAVEAYEKKINEMKSYAMKQIIKEFGTEFLDDDVKENDLLVFMLRNGYIDENFENYINYFHPNSITKDDMNFILGIRNHRSVGDYTYTISNPKRVFVMLKDYEFKQNEALNFDMVDYVLDNSKSSAFDNLFDKLKDQSQESLDFIKAYVERDKHLDVFFKNICNENADFWRWLTADDAIAKETQYKYLINMLKYTDIVDIVAMNYSRWEGEESENTDSIVDLLISDVDSLKKLIEAPVDKIIKLIVELDIKFTDVDIQDVDEKIQNAIIDNWAYTLNSKMLHRIFKLKQSEYEDRLDTQNYTSILEWDFKPLIDYVQDNSFFVSYVENVVLGIKTNTQESVESIEDIFERISENNIDLCMQLIEKQKTVWEDISICLDNVDGGTEAKKLLWKKLLDCDKAKATWENYVIFYNLFGLEKELGRFFEQHINEFLSNTDNEVITDEIINGLLYIELSENEFRRCVQTFEIKNYDRSIKDFGKEKVTVLIEENALLFNMELWKEMQNVYPMLTVKYAKMNNEEFIEYIDKIELLSAEINEILVDGDFSESDKKVVLGKVAIKNLDNDTANILKDLSFAIGRPLADVTWNILDVEKKYKLLLNQMSLFTDDELASMFRELEEEYHCLSERTGHMYKLAATEYNKVLLEKLAKRDYVTSFQMKKEGEEDVLVGDVKQRKSTPVVGN